MPAQTITAPIALLELGRARLRLSAVRRMVSVGEDITAPVRSATLQQAYDAYQAAQARVTSTTAAWQAAQSQVADAGTDKVKLKAANLALSQATTNKKAAEKARNQALSTYADQAETERTIAEDEARVAQSQFDVTTAQQKSVTVKSATAQLLGTPVATGLAPNPITGALAPAPSPFPIIPVAIAGGLVLAGGLWWYLRK